PSHEARRPGRWKRGQPKRCGPERGTGGRCREEERVKMRRVRKRDGREEPFDKAKIAGAVARAQAAVGASDPQFAGEVAELVEMALTRRQVLERAGPTPAGGTSGSSSGAGASLELVPS